MTTANRFRFRAWDEVNKRMEYPTEMRFREGTPIDMRSESYRMIWLRDGTPLMQSTGLLDRNGVGIFEGDILKNRWQSGVVAWIDTIAAFSWSGGGEWGMIEGSEVEILGNIYEHSHLLK